MCSVVLINCAFHYHDLEEVKRVGAEIGLQLNEGKTELICCNHDTKESLLPFLPGALVVEP